MKSQLLLPQSRLPQNSVTSGNHHVFACGSGGWRLGLGSSAGLTWVAATSHLCHRSWVVWDGLACVLRVLAVVWGAWSSSPGHLQVASLGSFSSCAQRSGCSKNQAGPKEFANCSMAQSQRRFGRWPSRLFLRMEGATKAYCEGTLIGKEDLLWPSLGIEPQKATNNQEKNAPGEGHP